MLLVAASCWAQRVSAADELLNRHFRESAQALNQTLAFAAENQGKVVEKRLPGACV